MAAQPRRGLPQCERNACGIACGTAAQEAITHVSINMLNAKSPILDTRGVGQYGPRGFEGGEKPGISSTSRVWTMSDGTRGARSRETPTDEAALSARLKRLGERLDQIKSEPLIRYGSASRPATDHRRWRAVSGSPPSLSRACWSVRVSAGFIDRWLGTLPWGMFVFALLGFAAGVLNVMRAGGRGDPEAFRTRPIERRDDERRNGAQRQTRRPVMADPIHNSRSTRSSRSAQDRRARDRIHEFAAFMVIAVGMIGDAAGRRDLLAQHRAGPAAIARGAVLRVHRDARCEVPPAARG